MKNRILITTILVLISLGDGQLIKAKTEPPGKWVLLGTRNVDFKLDRDVLVLGAGEGVYTSLKLKVTEGAINMHKMVVEYGNGERDEIELRHNFSRGSDSRVIDLHGHKRIIKSITFWYDTKGFAGKKAKLLVFGRHP